MNPDDIVGTVAQSFIGSSGRLLLKIWGRFFVAATVIEPAWPKRWFSRMSLVVPIYGDPDDTESQPANAVAVRRASMFTTRMGTGRMTSWKILKHFVLLAISKITGRMADIGGHGEWSGLKTTTFYCLCVKKKLIVTSHLLRLLCPCSSDYAEERSNRRALGNAVVPEQAAYAIQVLINYALP